MSVYVTLVMVPLRDLFVTDQTNIQLVPVPESMSSKSARGWSGGAMELGKLPVPGRPTYLDHSRARAYCACSVCGWGLFGHFSLVYHFSFLSPSLWETAQYRLKYCLKGPSSPKQPTNQSKSACC